VVIEDVAEVVDGNLVHLSTELASIEPCCVGYLQVVQDLVLLLAEGQELWLLRVDLAESVEAWRDHILHTILPHELEQVDCQPAHLVRFLEVEDAVSGKGMRMNLNFKEESLQ